MTLFIALAAALTVLIIVWMVWPLLRPTPLNNVSSLRLNAAIYREQLDALEKSRGTGGNRLFYLATPPGAFLPIARQLGRTGMLTVRPQAQPAVGRA